MVPSSADIVLQNSRISESETITINIILCGVVNIMELQHVRVSGDRNVTSSVFYVIVRLSRHLDISQRMSHGVRSYADHLIILAPNVQSQKIMVGIFNRYAYDYDVAFNAKKSQLIIFNHDNNIRPPDPEIIVNGEIVNLVGLVVHLGHLLSENINNCNTTKCTY